MLAEQDPGKIKVNRELEQLLALAGAAAAAPARGGASREAAAVGIAAEALSLDRSAAGALGEDALGRVVRGEWEGAQVAARLLAVAPEDVEGGGSRGFLQQVCRVCLLYTSPSPRD